MILKWIKENNQKTLVFVDIDYLLNTDYYNDTNGYPCYTLTNKGKLKGHKVNLLNESLELDNDFKYITSIEYLDASIDYPSDGDFFDNTTYITFILETKDKKYNIIYKSDTVVIDNQGNLVDYY